MQYEAKKTEMEKEKPNLPANIPLERSLWHGTNENAIDSIIMHGFNRSYAGDNGNGLSLCEKFRSFCANRNSHFSNKN